MSKHTPGPWEVEEDEVFDKVTHWIVSGHHGIAEVHVCSGGWREYMANARLLAAAPELLNLLEQAQTALRMAIDSQSTGWYQDTVLADISTLLLRVRGETAGDGDDE